MCSDAKLVVGVLALQGGFLEHLVLLRTAAQRLASELASRDKRCPDLRFTEVRTEPELEGCDALIIPGGESTTISLVAAQCGLLEPLRNFVLRQSKPTWGTCAGMILLADEASATKKGGQELIGGLAIRVHRNHFGRQVESFAADLRLPFLDSGSPEASAAPFPGIFIRAPIVETVLCDDDGPRGSVDILALLPTRRSNVDNEATENIIAVRQGNIFGTSFHPELTGDDRIHVWWLTEVARTLTGQS